MNVSLLHCEVYRDYDNNRRMFCIGDKEFLLSYDAEISDADKNYILELKHKDYVAVYCRVNGYDIVTDGVVLHFDRYNGLDQDYPSLLLYAIDKEVSVWN